MKRFLSCFSSDLEHCKRADLVSAIAQSEGRVLVSETIGAVPPLLTDITNAEVAAAFGADLLILNLFDLDQQLFYGLPKDFQGSVIQAVKRLTGRPIGINLEPTQAAAEDDPNPFKMTPGRIASVSNARKAVEEGVDFLVLTGNPETGVDNAAIVSALKEIRAAVGEDLMLIAGKMHGSGILSECGERIIRAEDVKSFIAAGADVVLLPAPATIPGMTTEYIRSLVEVAHDAGALTMTAIGTSQEGADEASIKQIALMCKMTGTDLHHIGDSGYVGMALPENIMAYGVAIRGVRHTYHRMAASIRR